MTRRFVVWNTLQSEQGNASWALDDGFVTVRTAIGAKTAQLGGMSPEVLASLLVREISAEEGDQENA